MPGTAVDTNVVIAALLSWHEHHLNAFNAVNSILEDGDEALILPVPVLIEAYSVMTRLPAPHRLKPADAFTLLDGTFRQTARTVQLRQGTTWSFLRDEVDRQVSGGLIYDAQILYCAAKAGANRFLTFNVTHFEKLDTKGVVIERP